MEAKAVPKHHVEESDTVRSVTLPSWTIIAENHPISNATHLDELSAELDFPLPEMTFGHNLIRMRHKDSGWEYQFDTLQALKCVKNGALGDGDGGVTVKQSEAWLKSRTEPNSQTPMPAIVPTKPYDWTYTTMYEGHTMDRSTAGLSFQRADPSNPNHAIPMAELQRHDPILFYAQTLLFEDELHDNGSSALLIRLCFFRSFDTRIYHSFASSPPLIIKEVIGLEAPYEAVKRRLEDPEDLTPMTDATFVANTLSSFTPQEKQTGASTGWKGIGRKVEVATLHTSPKTETGA